MTDGPMTRTLVVWCPDWPVIAAAKMEGWPAYEPLAVLFANRVVACSAAARAQGVRRGQRKRDAQGRCPQLVVVPHDPTRDARAYEPVLIAIEEVAAGVEVIRPGLCALAARGPGRYFGGEVFAAEHIVEHLAQTCEVEAQIGIADGVFAAGIAARAGQLVPPGATPEFLAGLDVSALDSPALVDLLRRLGLRTLGEFAALPAPDVLARFGVEAAMLHRLAGGRDERMLAVRRPPPDLAVTQTFDEPLERIDTAAFAARQLAQRLHAKLAGYGLACSRLGIEAVTEHGETLHRTWRHDGLLTVEAIVDRVRWQLDGWLTTRARTAQGPTAGILRLRLTPDGVVEHAGFQLGLWGDAGEERDRAHRAFTRVQGLLGPEAVVTAVLGGGRDPADQIRLVPWGDDRTPPAPARPPQRTMRKTKPRGSEVPGGDVTGAGTGGLDLPGGEATSAGAPPGGGVSQPAFPGLDPPEGTGGPPPAHRAGGSHGRAGPAAMLEPPWPGRLPPPSPATVLIQPLPSRVLDPTRTPIGVSGRLALTGAPTWLVIGDDEPVEIAGWAGPWPVDERWWATGSDRRGSRRVRLQARLADGRALLLVLSASAWWVTAIYD